MELLIVFVGLFWIAPIFAGHMLGQSRDRTGWMWGLLLGWLGVLILACMKPIPTHELVANAEAEERIRLARATPDNPAGIWPPPGR
jgi:hypothetical protein